MRNDRELQEAQALIEEGDAQSIPSIRACVVALANHRQAPPEHLAALIAIEKKSVVQKNRKHVAVGEQPTELDPAWIEPNGPQ